MRNLGLQKKLVCIQIDTKLFYDLFFCWNVPEMVQNDLKILTKKIIENPITLLSQGGSEALVSKLY